MTQTFQPRLIGRNQQAMDNRIETWSYAVTTFNELVTAWNNLVTSTENIWDTKLNAKFDLTLLRSLLQEKYSTLEKFIQVSLINADPDYAKFAKRSKIEEVIRTTKFADYNRLIDILRRAKEFAIAKIPPVQFDRFINDIWTGEKFEFPDIIKTETEKEFTFFTQNQRENLVLEIASRISEIFSLINNLGGNITTRDLPGVLSELLEMNSTNIKRETLEFYHGTGSFSLMNFTASSQIKEGQQSIFHLLNNLSNEEISSLIQKLVSK